MKQPLCILLMLTFLSCSQKGKEPFTDFIKEWEGKEIVFPDNMAFIRYATDSMDYSMDSTYKVLTYVDTTGCSSCKLRLDEWIGLIKQTDTVVPGKLSFVFVFQPELRDELPALLETTGFELPVAIDVENRFQHLNNMPQGDILLQTFLLDPQNKVVMIGNPVYSARIWPLFIKKALGKTVQADKTKNTIVELDSTSAYLDNVTVGETHTVYFNLRNVGKVPLSIISLSTNCRCTKAFPEKQVVLPDDSVKIRVEYTPSHKGMFRESVRVICNTEKNPVLRIKGVVK
ncbi:DUF1573 domain-containing protein [Parabacteroides goldsteinii]|uniref:DUF1573 domain-containing protein n=1 Tax=Parabacteroides goldsteinii TaxID=328812 RepID=UPI002673E282|nr:DUF1573 domain-containing protein [Parabacteroides goldsteinii]